MTATSSINYHRIAEAIDYINHHFKSQPDLDEVAKHLHLSPFHFQRLFTEWAGTTPKKFLQYISISHAKNVLKQNHEATLFDAVYDTGLSGTSRLHDLFVRIEGMTPAEYRDEGKALTICYRFASTPFGKIILASTPRGVCYMAFDEDEAKAIQELKLQFRKAEFAEQSNAIQEKALEIFDKDRNTLEDIKLHLKGTPFQLKVWEALLKIPLGSLATYGAVANQIGNPKAARAVGTAIGSNPIAYLIPCHRVIQGSGVTGGYMWGSTRKQAIIGWECAAHHSKGL
ncbi:MAG TPA: methylated-DNA--[protein]-cysteine S-methyltransferase [Flavipsychrobacter sp.]|nr:methylated-DNA--[protein]-cysteine S-methyltransferase [Flavipsychrobacter sp.]